MPRTPYVAANWKMHKTVAETEAFLGELLPKLPDGPEVVICPPYPSLARAVELCGDRVAVAAQNMHEDDAGAFTGEVSPPMLLELGVKTVVLGHSERREYFGETDAALARKLVAALERGLQPILCVGENLMEREGDRTEAKLEAQLSEDLGQLPDERLGEIVIAYEPIWAIGTGRTASTDQAQDAIAFIRGRIADRSSEAGEAIRILYGGSVKPDNAAELISRPDVDGALVGGASLEPADFLAIVRAAG